MAIQLSALQSRIIGVLLEKQTTTPEQYPLTLNALTLGCNQKSNRDPVFELSEAQVQDGLRELEQARLVSSVSGSRVARYQHRFCNTEFGSLQLSEQQRAMIGLLLLRGPQTPGELRTRSSRLADFSQVSEVEACLQSLVGYESGALVVQLPREAGKRESRYQHLLGDEADVGAVLVAPASREFDASRSDFALEQEVAELRADVTQLRCELAQLRDELAQLKG
jgi:uncharacterized protein YceH (UPF0502 family)